MSLLRRPSETIILRKASEKLIVKNCGKFRQLLTDLIKTKHNSNHKTHQTTLEGEVIQEYIYYVLGFAPVDVLRLKKDIWFSKLNSEQINSVEKFLETKNRLMIKS